MSMIGDLLGYNGNGEDLLGSNRDPDQNCLVCGISVYRHNAAMNAECTRKLYSAAQEATAK